MRSRQAIAAISSSAAAAPWFRACLPTLAPTIALMLYFMAALPSNVPGHRRLPTSPMRQLLGRVDLALPILLLCAAAGFSAGAEPPSSPEVDVAMKPYLDSYKLAGVIGIIADKDGVIRFRNLIGYADVAEKRPISESDVFWIASMTKMFVGASIMMLVDEGKVSLDDPVTKFIPQLDKWMVIEEKDAQHEVLKPVLRPVTIRHV